MNQFKRVLKNEELRGQVARFLIAGFSAVGTDYFVYKALLNVTIEVSVAKIISFLAGTVVAFILNKYFTFKVGQKSYREIAKFVILYCSTLLLNVGVNKFVLSVLGFSAGLAFLFATGASTVANFIGQKYFVFKAEVNG